jgi:hypothetical protein
MVQFYLGIDLHLKYIKIMSRLTKIDTLVKSQKLGHCHCQAPKILQ